MRNDEVGIYILSLIGSIILVTWIIHITIMPLFFSNIIIDSIWLLIGLFLAWFATIYIIINGLKEGE